MPKVNPEKVRKAREFMERWFHLTPVALVRKTAQEFKIYGEPRWLNDMAQEMSYPFPSELIGCWGTCGFTRAGAGWQCKEGEGCGKFVGPGDRGFKELTEYYRRAHAIAGA